MPRRVLGWPVAAAALAMSWPAAAQNATDAPNAAELVSQARIAARGDRNAEAARLFDQAIQADPAVRAAVLREFADQLTYSDKAAKAVPLYREVLARPDLAQDERRWSLSGLALALSWSGQNRAAVQTYTQILAAAPDDLGALLGRGRVRTWLRRYAEAESDFRAAIALDPYNHEAWRGLVEAQSYAGHQREALETLRAGPAQNDTEGLSLLGRTQFWGGQPELARDTLTQALALDPRQDGIAQLADEVALSMRPLAEASVRRATQSDDYDIAQASAWQYFHPGSDLTLGFGYDGAFYRSATGPDVDVHRPSVSARLRLSDKVEVNGRLGLVIEDEPGGTDHAADYSTWATYIPSDHLRFDLGTSRSTLDNVQSILLDIRTNTYSASVDIGSDAAWKASLRGSYTAYTDGNSRTWEQVELRRRIGWSPNIFLGARYTHFDFAQVRAGGYFNPEKLDAVEALAQVWGKAGRFYYDLRGTIGGEFAEPGDGKPIYSVEGRLTYLLGKRVQIEGYVNSFSSKLGSAGGFSRTTLGLTLRARW
ncbi:MAG: hypothetical protein QM676_02185 [Novosphingobium sp.]